MPSCFSANQLSQHARTQASQIASQEKHWYNPTDQPWSPDESIQSWLLDTSSLTQRLKETYPGSFQVDVISHDWGIPAQDERYFLSMEEQDSASIREVVLLCNNIPRVYARSILPKASLKGANRQLLGLESRPLGEFLFSQPSIERRSIEITLVQGAGGVNIWGRRSLFMLNNQPLVVCEYFLPTDNTSTTTTIQTGQHHGRAS